MWAGIQLSSQENTPCSLSPLERELEGLLPQITTIHEKQRPMDFGVFDEAVDRANRRERLPTAVAI